MREARTCSSVASSRCRAFGLSAPCRRLLTATRATTSGVVPYSDDLEFRRAKAGHHTFAEHLALIKM